MTNANINELIESFKMMTDLLDMNVQVSIKSNMISIFEQQNKEDKLVDLQSVFATFYINPKLLALHINI